MTKFEDDLFIVGQKMTLAQLHFAMTQEKLDDFNEAWNELIKKLRDNGLIKQENE